MRILIATMTGVATAAILLGCTGPSAPPSPAAPPSPPVSAASSTPPEWLYPKVVRAVVKDPNAPRHVPGSPVTYTDGQLHDLFTTLDWRPEQHPPMPPVVAKGRQPDVQACGYCHLATGQGRPESAPVAGLPVAYFISQMQAFASNKRHTSSSGAVVRPDGTQGGGRLAMNTMAAKMTPEEMQAAAEYFAKLPYKPWIKVVESDTAPPLTYETAFPIPHPDQPAEPIAGRIVDMGTDPDRALIRDPDIGFIALVPKGSVARGKVLAETRAAGGPPACATCHGAGLRGGPGAIAPPIAGRSPTYIARALYDFAHGSRDDAAAQPMKPSAAKLSLEDMVALAAYVGSLQP
jgi:cytochrome c553